MRKIRYIVWHLPIIWKPLMVGAAALTFYVYYMINLYP